jgi:hypothetical protein
VATSIGILSASLFAAILRDVRVNPARKYILLGVGQGGVKPPPVYPFPLLLNMGFPTKTGMMAECHNHIKWKFQGEIFILNAYGYQNKDFLKGIFIVLVRDQLFMFILTKP